MRLLYQMFSGKQQDDDERLAGERGVDNRMQISGPLAMRRVKIGGPRTQPSRSTL